MHQRVGVLVDGPRYGRTSDPAEWDAFRTLVLLSQGWTVHRLWTPHFVRDPERALRALMERVEAEVRKDRVGTAPTA